jgi:hypothetical protein
MEKPDLSQMWETFVRIGIPPIPLHQIVDAIRTKIHPMVSFSHNNIMAWYCFLIHDKTSGVPTTEDDKNAYFHIRFTVKKNTSIKGEKDINKYLPEYCEKSMTRRCSDVASIQGIEKSILKDGDIAESWKLMGEQSEWVLTMLKGHEENAQIPVNQLVQFMHFFMNMLGLGGQSILFLGPILPF